MDERVCHMTPGREVVFDGELLRRYDVTGPRYTSYPTAPQFHDGFSTQTYSDNARATNDDLIPRPLSLYVHLPFCARVCFYCACNKVITANRAHAAQYLRRLKREMDLQAELFDRDRSVHQLHLGGGTPTFLSHGELGELMAAIGEHFSLVREAGRDYAVEVDPREANSDTIALLSNLGFNRISVGVQDLDPQVQKAVNRIQPIEMTEAVIQAARKSGYRSVSVDLIYGLPRQSVASFDRTLDAVLELDTDRVVVFNYAHMPQMFKSQRHIRESELPAAGEKLEILRHAVQRLTGAGYVYIGMDHFAKPSDELALAQQSGALQRNFQGYSTHGDCDLVGLGVTAIGMVGESYSQNLRGLEDYYRCLDEGVLPVFRGLQLSADDILRRDVIMRLMCHFQVDISAVEDAHGIRFGTYFAEELRRLAEMEAEGLVEMEPDRIIVNPVGRLLVRNIAMVFDAYLHRQGGRYSRTI